jgi:hypothetical protein
VVAAVVRNPATASQTVLIPPELVPDTAPPELEPVISPPEEVEMAAEPVEVRAAAAVAVCEPGVPERAPVVPTEVAPVERSVPFEQANACANIRAQTTPPREAFGIMGSPQRPLKPRSGKGIEE